MRLAKWGDGLGILLPAGLVEEAGLKEGDDVDIRLADDKTIELITRQRRDEAIRRLQDLARRLPADFVFDRNEANER